MVVHSHTVRNIVAAVIGFTAFLVILAVVAGAGLAVFVAIVLASLAVPLVIIVVIHHDEGPIENRIKRSH